eukprot:3173605-Prymnesium_polylepis.1
MMHTCTHEAGRGYAPSCPDGAPCLPARRVTRDARTAFQLDSCIHQTDDLGAELPSYVGSRPGRRCWSARPT